MNTLQDYSVSGVKSFQGMEGLGFNATLLKNGKKIAFVIDDASGGEISIQWTNNSADEKQILRELVKTLPLLKISNMHIKQNEAIFIEGLINKYEENKKLTQWCKSKTLFRLNGDEVGSWRTLNVPYNERAKTYLTRYSNIEEIANERF